MTTFQVRWPGGLRRRGAGGGAGRSSEARAFQVQVLRPLLQHLLQPPAARPQHPQQGEAFQVPPVQPVLRAADQPGPAPQEARARARARCAPAGGPRTPRGPHTAAAAAVRSRGGRTERGRRGGWERHAGVGGGRLRCALCCFRPYSEPALWGPHQPPGDQRLLPHLRVGHPRTFGREGRLLFL